MQKALQIFIGSQGVQSNANQRLYIVLTWSSSDRPEALNNLQPKKKMLKVWSRVDLFVRCQTCRWRICLFGLTYSRFLTFVDPGKQILVKTCNSPTVAPSHNVFILPGFRHPLLPNRQLSCGCFPENLLVHRNPIQNLCGTVFPEQVEWRQCTHH